ncbi:hypothetical protein HUE58_04120 [Candidatus Ruthia endofausta]|uniref:Uncharacterized protein n=1 Tax=Candidatus Ruthia endofausta TaxID=2738852 RepID=A0A6N0HPX6_9GAMM|nr:hypothetical protein [Candidatus Ruthia endofausta]QKQ24321.1 hypothetical protein HUE58_04120 [Candidatus Ruthia endofausta]
MLNNDKELQLQLNKLKIQAPSAYAIQSIIKKSKAQMNAYIPSETIALSLLTLPKKMILLFILILGIAIGWGLTNEIADQDSYLFSDYQQGVFYE